MQVERETSHEFMFLSLSLFLLANLCFDTRASFSSLTPAQAARTELELEVQQDDDVQPFSGCHPQVKEIKETKES